MRHDAHYFALSKFAMRSCIFCSCIILLCCEVVATCVIGEGMTMIDDNDDAFCYVV